MCHVVRLGYWLREMSCLENHYYHWIEIECFVLGLDLKLNNYPYAFIYKLNILSSSFMDML